MKSIKDLPNYEGLKEAFIKGDKEWHEKEWKEFIVAVKKQAATEIVEMFQTEVDEIGRLAPSSRDDFWRGLYKAITLIKKKYKL